MGSVTGVLLFVVIVIVMLGIIYLIHKVRKKHLLKMEEAQRDIGAWYEHHSLCIHNGIESTICLCQ